MSWYDRIQTAKASNRATLNAGQYTMQIREIKEISSFKGKTWFIAECNLLASSSPSFPPGTVASFMAQLDGPYPDMALTDIRNFAAACFGYDPADPRVLQEITPQVIQAMLHPTQPMAGRVIQGTISEKTSKSTGKVNLKWTFAPVLENGQPKTIPLPAPIGSPIVTPNLAPAPANGVNGHAMPYPTPGLPGPVPAPSWTPAQPSPSPSPVQVPGPVPADAPAPGLPLPPAPPAQVAPPANPQPWLADGWGIHPTAQGWWYRGQEVKNEAQLREMYGL